ncbi:Uncharacterized conserved protein YkwD, contains CAP (CSP/antigen 5/PR1) domain [Lachnospiraceae bacterium]|nr:Uncharacterized conserved protein YkwD, contains CAP (CSP/antigen 5/PR1) domain [Lachnospiraceae bacterium]
MKKETTRLLLIVSLIVLFVTVFTSHVSYAADTYKIMSGEKVLYQSDAPGKYNAIVFGRPGCADYFLEYISNSKYLTDSNLQFMYVDVDDNDEATVTEYAKNYSSKITYYYGGDNVNCFMFSNLRTANNIDMDALPILCFVDENRNVVKSTNYDELMDVSLIDKDIEEVLGYTGSDTTVSKGYSMTSVDESTIYTTPQSPKKLNVIVFGRPECMNTQGTLTNISNSDWVSDANVGFVYADIDGNNKDTVKAFAKDYSSYITFCYGNNNSLAWSMSGASGTVSLPFVVYVDENGNTVESTTGYQSANSIYSVICDTLGYEKVTDNFTVQTKGSILSDEARTMLEMVNDFRTGNEAWYWNSDNSTKTFCSGLEELTYDYELERIAIERAKELSVYYSHTRPDGTSCFSAYPEGEYWACGENIAYGYTSADWVFTAWREDDDDYSGQGHRRNMLNDNFNAVGFACFEVSGIKFWVQEFGNKEKFSDVNTTSVSYPTSEQLYEVLVSDEVVSITEVIAPQNLTIDVWEEKEFDTSLSFKSGYSPYVTLYLPTSVNVKDTSVIKLKDNVLSGLKPGNTQISLSARISGSKDYKKDITVTVSPVSIEKSVISISNSVYDYTGKEIKPDVSVSLNGAVLKVGEDYSVSYKNNIKAGTATITVSGIGNYAGDKSISFTIKAESKNTPVVTKDNKTTFSIKNKKTIKKTAKIKVKDKDKIKKITLNGKTVKIKKNKTSVTIKLKSYKKTLKKKGKWNKLVVTDVNGNTKSIKFKTK